MQNARAKNRLVLCCPVCWAADHVVDRRIPGERTGHVVNKCTCNRCGTAFQIEENAAGLPVEN